MTIKYHFLPSHVFSILPLKGEDDREAVR